MVDFLFANIFRVIIIWIVAPTGGSLLTIDCQRLNLCIVSFVSIDVSIVAPGRGVVIPLR